MKYSNSEIKQQNRRLDETTATELLTQGEYGVLSMQCAGGDVYGIPFNYAYNGQQSIFLHCAPHGRKLDCLDKYPGVSFCVVGNTRVIPEEFTTDYTSIVLECRVSKNLSEEERMEALILIVDKYAPQHKERGVEYARKLLHKTEILRLDIARWSGKSLKNKV